MKIREIISEAPAGDIGRAVGGATNLAAKGIGAVAGGAVAAPKRIVKGVAAGAAAFDKLMSPSRWFSGKDDKADTDDNTDKDNNTTAKYVDSLNAVAQGLNPSSKDIENLKLLALPGPDKITTPEEQAVLKAAYSGHRLTPQQVAIIKQITAKL
jgi:hypothetical protein